MRPILVRLGPVLNAPQPQRLWTAIKAWLFSQGFLGVMCRVGVLRGMKDDPWAFAYIAITTFSI